MTDKIITQGRNNLDITQTRARAVEVAQRGKPDEAGKQPGVAQDAVELTSTVTNLRRIEAKLSVMPQINQSRVDEIRQILQSGTYQINPEQLAQKMLQLDRELA